MSASLPFAELAVTTNYSFLYGGSHAAELVQRAEEIGLSAIGVADRNSLAGVVRAHVAVKGTGLRLVVGARLVLREGFEVICYPTDRQAYGKLTKFLTEGRLRAPKGDCDVGFDDLHILGAGHRFIVMPFDEITPQFAENLARFADFFAGTTYLALSPSFGPGDQNRFERLDALSRAYGTPLVATNDVLYHIPNRRPLQDVLTCIREHCTIEEAGFRLERNAERYLKSGADMARLLAGYEEAMARTLEIVADCRFSLDEIEHHYPSEVKGKSTTPQAELERLTWEGVARRFPDGVPEETERMIRHELTLIANLSYAPYFLTVEDIVRFARTQDPPILCQGRGSAANSVVCYCLGITAVNPTEVDLLFERFISTARNEPPDIDVDFEHERREEVIQYIYAKYGRRRAGLAATVIRYRGRSAMRDVGKVMGLSSDMITTLSGMLWGWSAKPPSPDDVRAVGLNPADKRLMQALILARQLVDFPRHLSQHVGGFVITETPLDEVVPIINAAMEERTTVEWDKDDLDALGILKVDVLALGMLTCLRKTFDLLRDSYGIDMGLARVPREDRATYEMIQAADTIGVFQIESRAQMSMLPRLKPRTFYDLVIEVAIVRPGPIQGDMVNPYLRRRQGLDPVRYPSPEMERVLKKTLGVPLFQEQAMKIAIIGAGFSPEKADRLRRAMASFRNVGTINKFKDDFIKGMIANKYEREFAERCFKQIEGFSDYGFPESHSASFSLLAYASSWLKCHYPDVFACALLNSQPMGFYSAATIVRDFQEHGGAVRAADINHGDWDYTLEPLEGAKAQTRPGGNSRALRVGLRQVDGLSEARARQIVALRGDGYKDMQDFYRRTFLDRKSLQQLAKADAFRSIGLDRRQALWEIKGVLARMGKLGAPDELPLFAQDQNGLAALLQPADHVELPALKPGEQVFEDYAALRLSLKAHPVSFLRGGLADRGVTMAQNVWERPSGEKVDVAGLVLVRQRPGTASGVIFLTLEDETGAANVIVWPKVFEAYRRVVMGARMISVRGVVQAEQGVTHVVAQHLESLVPDLMGALSGAEEPVQPTHPAGSLWKHPRNVRVLPKGRNFH